MAKTKSNTAEKHFSPRHLARDMARNNMKRAGIQRPNKHMSGNWRNFVHLTARGGKKARKT